MHMRMIVIGTGPIGGIIGGRLARAGADITFVDIDKEHVSAIRDKGLQVDVPDGPFNVRIKIVYPNEIDGKFDTGCIAVRSNYTPDALNTVLPHLATDGLLVSMQNGINPPLLQEKVGADRTVGMAIRMGCRKVGPGHVQTDTRGHLYIGHLHGKTTPRLEDLQQNPRRRHGNRNLRQYLGCPLEQAHLHLPRLLRFSSRRLTGDDLHERSRSPRHGRLLRRSRRRR